MTVDSSPLAPVPVRPEGAGERGWRAAWYGRLLIALPAAFIGGAMLLSGLGHEPRPQFDEAEARAALAEMIGGNPGTDFGAAEATFDVPGDGYTAPGAEPAPDDLPDGAAASMRIEIDPGDANGMSIPVRGSGSDAYPASDGWRLVWADADPRADAVDLRVMMERASEAPPANGWWSMPGGLIAAVGIGAIAGARTWRWSVLR